MRHPDIKAYMKKELLNFDEAFAKATDTFFINIKEPDDLVEDVREVIYRRIEQDEDDI